MSASNKVADTTALAQYASIQDDPLIREAIRLLEKRIFKRSAKLSGPDGARDYLRLKLAGEALEVFAVLFLDTKHHVIAYEPMFHGTIDGASVYPRAVLKRAIEHNCSAVIFAHNHPSGTTKPSHADKEITSRLKSVLELVDVRVLDHFIVGKGTPFSFAETGLL